MATAYSANYEPAQIHPLRLCLSKAAAPGASVAKEAGSALNVGSMTGRGREVADLITKKQNNVLCVHETRWKVNKSKELGNVCKLIYSGSDGEGRKGVGIIVSES